jgi:LDH2 family malate/lactate/ureidoglycolate dehydrogenase
MSAYTKVPSEKARRFCQALFQSYRFSGEESRVITDVLLAADFAGVESHGIQRLVRYHEEIVSGCVDIAARPQTVFETALSEVIDAKKEMGQLTGVRAMDRAIEKAREQGVGIALARNSNHIGLCGYYAERALRHDLIGICMTNTEAIAVPTFGSSGVLGTNPIAFAMNAAPHPFLLDISTTVVPRGRIEVYAKNGEALPEAWAVDAEGKATADAALVIDNIVRKAGGGILPLGGALTGSGGHKGFGLGIIVEILTGVLSGGLTSNWINRVEGHTGICNTFIALDCALFGDRAAITEKLSVFLREIRESPKARGQSRIFIPGEQRAERAARRAAGTIPVSAAVLSELRELSRARGVAFDLE